MSLLSPMLVTLKTSAGATRQADLAIHMDTVTQPIEPKVQGVPVDIFDVYTFGWTTPMPAKTDVLVDQATSTIYRMHSTIFTGHDGLQFQVSQPDSALIDDCQILRDTEGTLDAMGGAPHTWPLNSTVKSAVVNMNAPSRDYEIANQIVGMVVKKVLLPLGTTVLKTDRLSIKAITYKVVEAIPVSSYSVFTEVVVVATTLGV